MVDFQVGLCLLAVMIFLVLTIRPSKSYTVVKEYHEDGFEVRKSPGRVWVEVLNEQKYHAYLTRRATQFWKKHESRR